LLPFTEVFSRSVALSVAKQQITPAQLKWLMDNIIIRKSVATDEDFHQQLIEFRARVYSVKRQLNNDAASGLSLEFIKKIYEIIHSEAIGIQTNLFKKRNSK